MSWRFGLLRGIADAVSRACAPCRVVADMKRTITRFHDELGARFYEIPGASEPYPSVTTGRARAQSRSRAGVIAEPAAHAVLGVLNQTPLNMWARRDAVTAAVNRFVAEPALAARVASDKLLARSLIEGRPPKRAAAAAAARRSSRAETHAPALQRPSKRPTRKAKTPASSAPRRTRCWTASCCCPRRSAPPPSKPRPTRRRAPC